MRTGLRAGGSARGYGIARGSGGARGYGIARVGRGRLARWSLITGTPAGRMTLVNGIGRIDWKPIAPGWAPVSRTGAVGVL